MQALNGTATLTDSFTALTADGTAQLVTITIAAQNDAAVISGDTTGNVIEAGGVANGTPETPIASGNLDCADVDNPGDSWQAVAAGAATYGTYALTAAGVWLYTLNNSNPDVQALNVGDPALTDTFTVLTADGTPQMVTITITGSNDAAVISGTTSGSVTEAGGVNNGTPGIPTATGDLNSTDVDNAADAWTVISSPIASASGYGTFTIDAAGVWTYTLDDNNPAVQALKVGDILADTFTVTTVDGTAQLVTVTINGANDAAVITGTATGTVVEAGGVANDTPGTPVAVGNLGATDVDNPPDDWTPVGTATASTNGYGSYTLTAAGVWAYTLNDGNAAVQALNAGQTLTDTFTVTTVDGTAQLVTIVINGTNDVAVISGTTSGSVTEAGGVNNGTPGIPTATGDLNSTDVDNAADAWTVISSPIASASGYGTFTIDAAGVWTYTLDDNNAAVQALNGTATLTDSFTALTADGTAQLVTITIAAQNDAAVISGDTTGNVIEAGGVANGTPETPIASGNLDCADVDNPGDSWQAVAAGAATYGTYALTAAGVWLYTLNNSNPDVQALNVGDPALTDTFTVLTADGTPQMVTITITGSNDAAVISGTTSGSVTEAGGVNNGTPGIPTATGDLNSTDVDNAADAWTVISSPIASASGYGTFTIDAAGVWTYTLDDNNPAVQALKVGDILADTFTVTTVDGTAQLVTVTINGANDAAVITGTAAGMVVEAGGVGSGIPGTPVATGNLHSTDVDNPNDAWTPAATASANGYGTFTIDAAGLWTYTLDNANATVQALGTGDILPDSFTVTTIDGTPQVVTITITGTDDAAVISGDFTGTVLEAGGVNNGMPGIPTATGNLDAADDDNPPDWTPVDTPAASTSGYGTYTLTAAGAWAYTLDDSNAAVQALNAGQTLTDTFTALTVGGTAQVVTITIDGANDAAVITGDTTGSVIEAGGVANGTPGTSTVTGDLNSTDVDNQSDLWEPVSTLLRGTGGYGTYTVTTDGAWSYTLDDSNPDVQKLNVGGTLTDTFTAFTVDGTAQLVTITIHGTDDAAVITGTATGTVVEAGGVANGTPGTPTATGDLNSADVDNPGDGWQAVAAGAATTNGYGSYALSATGVWTYTLDDNNPAVQALNVGKTLTDTFTALTVGGTAQVVTITIDGANDAAVITGDTTGSVIEAGGIANGTPGASFVVGDLDASDVDNTFDSWTAIETPTLSANGYGTFTVDAAGLWVYILDDDNAAVQALNVGGALTDTFTAVTIDGTSQVVTITIHGTNDAAIIIGPATGTVMEAGGVADGTPGTPTATGDLTAIDVDNAADSWQAVAAGAATTNGYGSYALTAAGVWTYTIDNSNAAVQALNVGDILTDTFTVTTVDGTARIVNIIINGANDAAVITGDTAGSVVEAGGIANGAPGISIADGHLNSTDVDNPDDAWEPVGTSLRGASGYGSYTLTAAGVWTYTLDNSNAAVQKLNVGGTLTDTFTAFTVDGTAQLVTITIQGANDAAVITGTATGTVVEAGGVANGAPGTPTATSDLNSTDVDNVADAWTAVATATASANGYGSYTLTAAGVWAYTLNDGNAAVQALNAGQTLTDTFTVTTVDGTAQLVTIVINGTNDVAVISGTTSGSVTEAGGANNGTPGTSTVTGDLNSTDVDNPGDAWDAVGASLRGTGGYGTYAVTTDGAWSYTLDDSNPDVQKLNVGGTLTDTFTAFTVDGTAQLVTITIHGTDDAAVITGTATGTVVEAGGVANGTPGIPAATGDLNATDVDNPSDAWTVISSPAASPSGFGAYTLTAAGVWTYTLNNSNPAVQALNVGDILIDTFNVTTVDGTSQLVAITINGANDAAVITGTTTGTVVEAGGVNNGTPGIPIATGDLNSTDVDNPGDAWDAVGASLRGASGYGSYTLTAAGVWTYTLDNSNAAVQALNAGQTLIDTFTATTVDGTSQVVSIVINGANDAAVITGPVTGVVTEAGGVSNGTPGTPTATGNLDAADIDNPNDAWTAVSSPTASASGFGSYTLTATGVWTYTLDNSNPAVQALNVGDVLIDTFTVTTVDGTAQLVTVTINGANDAAVITGDTAGSVTEAGGVANGTPGTPTATGDLTSTEVDNPPDAWDAVGASLRGDSGFGTYTLTAGGAWTYTLDNSNAAVQALNAGQTLTDTFTASTVDGTSQVVSIIINGANDAAVITGPVTGAVTEAGGVANGTPGTPTATGNPDAADVDNAADAWTAVGTATASASGYGSYTLTATGVWTYTLDNSNLAVQALNVGDVLIDTFTVTTVDGTAQLVTVTINGANDAAVITGETTGSVIEAGGVGSGIPGTPTATGDLTSTEVDNPPDAWTAVGTATASANGYGSYTLTAGGAWTYTLDNANATVQALGTGATLADSFTVTTIDGSEQVVTITIHGTDDAAVISGDFTGTVLEAGGIANGTPGIPTATGNLDAADDDDPPDWRPVDTPASSANGYGTYTLTAAGVWAFTLDNSNAAVQALNAGQTLTDTFTAATIDGTEQVVTITINGANDAAVITGDTTATVHEAGGVANGTPGIPTATGDLNSTDIDNPNDLWEPDGTVVLRGDSGFSTYTVTTSGVWTYTLDNSNPTVQALNVGQSLTDTFTAITIDGTQQRVTITIEGANDAAVISGTTSGSVTEAGGVNNGTPGIPTATGDLNATDVDNAADAWTAVNTATASANGYGTYTLTAAGVWAYALNNNNAAVQALNVGQTLTDTFTVTTIDGTSQLVTITINGANDAAVITGDTTATVHEAGGVANGTPGIPTATGDLNSTDIDNPNDLWEPDGTVVLRGDSGFSTYTVTTSGVWTYTLDNSNPTVQALNVGQSLTDTFTAITIDGTQQRVTITIEGANDAAVISGTTSGSVTEAGGVNNGTPGIPTATGDLNATDVDNAADAWTAVNTATASANGYGTYTLTAAGVWAYALNNNNAAVQALNVGQSLTDTFTAITIDGTQQRVTITIEGANDAAVISGTTSGSVTEAGGVNNGTPGIPTATGDLNATDVDNAADAWTAVNTATASANGYGTYTLTAAGVWAYALNNNNAAVQALNVGQTLTDTFTVTTIDGTSQLVAITINGRNDSAVITGPVTGTVVEAGGVNNGTPGTPTATGDLNSTDVDNAADAWTAVSTATDSTGGFGSYTLTAAGVWAYTLNNSNATVQALNAGQTLTDTFTVTTIDGTSQLVAITINGRNDSAVITGPVTGTVVEAGGVNNGTPGTPTATGDLNSTDVDNAADAWTAVSTATDSTGGFGSYTLTAAGVWAYTLDNSNATVQALNAGQTLTDTFTAATIDGTSQLVTININGANDAAVITGTATGTVLEAGGIANGTPGILTATGNLDAADVDNPNDAWTAVTATASTGGFGSYTLTAAGVWIYKLDNSNATVQGLNAGQSLTDTFTAVTVDGTTKVVTVTINGSNDTPVAAADNNAGDPVTESGVKPGNTPFAGDPSAAGNVLINDLDVDSADAKTVVAVNGEAPNVGQPLTDTYGTLTLLANGNWSYALDNADPDTNALAQGQTAADVFTYTMADASGATSSSSLTIAVTGTNDAPDIIIRSGDSATANLTETGASLTTNGTLTVRDPDLTDTDTASVSAVALSGTTGGLKPADVLGMLSVTPGSIAADPGDTNNLGWTFNSGAQAFNFLNTGETLTLAYTVQATDGSASDAQTVTLNIAGSGGGPVAHDDTILVSNSTTVIIPWSALLANDSDPNATITSVTSLIGVTGGTIPVINLGFLKSIIFITPDTSDLTGNTFTYTISDGSGTSTATVNVGVMHVNTDARDTPDLSALTYDFSYISAGGGNDMFTGGPGTDDFFGGAGNDTYQFAFTGGGNDLVNESILGGGGNDIIQIVTPVGGSYTDLNFQAIDAQSSGSLNDLLITYNGQSITVINEFAANSNSQVETMSFNGGDFAGYSLGTGPYTINATTGGNDIVAGTSGNDSLTGGSGGNDLIFAGAGNDTVDGGKGDDLLVGGTGNDTLFGGSGNDTYLFALNDGIDTINENGGADRGGGNDLITIMANGAALSSLNFLDTVAGVGGNLVIDYNGQQITVINEFAVGNNSFVENLTFSGGASYLGYDLGSATYNFGRGANSIQTGDSADNTLTGGVGRDLIFGNAGNDTITGDGGTDLLVGGAGNDTITGGLDDDVIVGGTGNDILTGGGGNNRFVFAEAGPANVDTITDHSTRDLIDLSPLLDSRFGLTDNPADFARLVQNGSNVVVQVDLDGSANGHIFVDVALLQGYGTAGQDLVHVHFGNATHDMLV